MCEIVDKFIDLMKPYVINIDDDYQVLKEKENALNNLDDICKLIDGDNFKILDIELARIAELLDGFKSNEQEFVANKYIFETEIDEVKALPQYIDAKKYIYDFYDYLHNEYSKITDEFHELSDNYSEKELINKYYNMFVNNNVFVNDDLELRRLFDILDMSFEFKNDILIYILKENNKSYSNINNQEFTDEEKEKALNIIKNNELLDDKIYNELLDAVTEYFDLNKKIENIVDYSLIRKINICNIVLAKKIWLYRKIKFSYYNMNCKKCNCIIKEFNDICNLYERINKIKNQEDVIRIIKGES